MNEAARQDPVHGAWRAVRAALVAFDRFSSWVLIATMGAMSLMVSTQVFYRYVLGSSIDSADEVSRLLFVWVIFLAIPHGLKYGVHVGIDIVVMHVPPRVREGLFRLMCAGVALLMAAVLQAAWVSTQDKWQELMPTLPVTAALYYIPVLICAGHTLIHALLLARFGSTLWQDAQP